MNINYLKKRARAIQTEGVQIKVYEVNRRNPIAIMINDGDEETFQGSKEADLYLQGINDAMDALKKIYIFKKV